MGLRDIFQMFVDRAEAKHQVGIVLMFSEEGGRAELRNLSGRLTVGEWRQLCMELDAVATDLHSKYLPRGKKAASLSQYAQQIRREGT
jgi:hypothetical protein